MFFLNTMAFKFEPFEVDIESIHTKSKVILRRIGWLNLFKKFDGYNIEVTKSFAQTFDGEQA
jgi:hypothetical protein